MATLATGVHACSAAAPRVLPRASALVAMACAVLTAAVSALIAVSRAALTVAPALIAITRAVLTLASALITMARAVLTLAPALITMAWALLPVAPALITMTRAVLTIAPALITIRSATLITTLLGIALALWPALTTTWAAMSGFVRTLISVPAIALAPLAGLTATRSTMLGVARVLIDMPAVALAPRRVLVAARFGILSVLRLLSAGAPIVLLDLLTIQPGTAVLSAVPVGHGNEWKIRQSRHRQSPIQHPLDVLQQWRLVRRHERYSGPGPTGPRRAPDPMHVILGHIGQLVVDHMRQLLDVEPSRGDFGRHERRDLVGLEVGQRPDARALTLVAVNGGSLDAIRLELLRQPIGAVLRACEHQHLEPVLGVDQVRQQMPLVLFLYTIDLLVNAIGGGIARGYFDPGGIAQEARGELADLIGVSRGKHQILPLLRQQLQHAPDGMNEAHVQHAIRLIENEAAHILQVQTALLGQIEQPARCGHEQVAPLIQRINLGVDAHAAEHNDGAQSNILAITPGALGYLRRKLASRRQHEGAWRARLRSAQVLQDREYERGGFAGACLSAGQHITAGQDGGNCLRLDGSGYAVAFFVHSTQQLGLEPEIGK